MLIKVVGKRSEMDCNQEKTAVTLYRFKRISRCVEEESSSGQLIDKTSKTPGAKDLIDLSSKNKLRRPARVMGLTGVSSKKKKKN
jgi:hypothetical protein